MYKSNDWWIYADFISYLWNCSDEVTISAEGLTKDERKKIHQYIQHHFLGLVSASSQNNGENGVMLPILTILLV